MPRPPALLATLRVANAPSVISNVVLGYLLGSFYWGSSSEKIAADLTLLILAGLALYSSGNLANDWFDREWDAENRPERGLPTGLFSPGSYLAASLILAAASIFLALPLGIASAITAATIIALIALYTWAHKRHSWAIIPMGFCRAGLYFLGYFAAVSTSSEFVFIDASTVEFSGRSFVTVLGNPAFLITHALGLFAYIAGLSLTARSESLENPPPGPRFVARALLFFPLAAMSAFWLHDYLLVTCIALVPFASWMVLALTRFRKPVPRLVSALLAGIPLVDSIAAIPLGTTLILPALPIPLLAWVAFLTPPAGFALSLVLQRFTPAT